MKNTSAVQVTACSVVQLCHRPLDPFLFCFYQPPFLILYKGLDGFFQLGQLAFRIFGQDGVLHDDPLILPKQNLHCA